MAFRVALAGSSPRLREHLAALLRSGGFEVDLVPVDTLRKVPGQDAPAYDVMIAGTDAAADIGEAKLLESSLAGAGCFIFEENDDCSGDMPSFLLRTCMSQEDIIARLNGVIYRTLNKRRSARFKVGMPVEYSCLGTAYQSTIQDISENGVFIMTLSPLPDGTPVSLSFMLPGSGRMITARGHTVYSIQCDLDRNIITHPASHDTCIIAVPGIGVTFDALLPADRDAIRDYLVQRP